MTELENDRSDRSGDCPSNKQDIGFHSVFDVSAKSSASYEGSADKSAQLQRFQIVASSQSPTAYSTHRFA